MSCLSFFSRAMAKSSHPSVKSGRPYSSLFHTSLAFVTPSVFASSASDPSGVSRTLMLHLPRQESEAGGLRGAR